LGQSTIVRQGVQSEIRTYNLAIEIVFLDHHGVDTFGVPESEEAESTGTTGRDVAHDSTFADLSKLGEVVFERIYIQVNTTYRHRST
jgi:hypothetical protein